MIFTICGSFFGILFLFFIAGRRGNILGLEFNGNKRCKFIHRSSFCFLFCFFSCFWQAFKSAHGPAAIEARKTVCGTAQSTRSVAKHLPAHQHEKNAITGKPHFPTANWNYLAAITYSTASGLYKNVARQLFTTKPKQKHEVRGCTQASHKWDRRH